MYTLIISILLIFLSGCYRSPESITSGKIKNNVQNTLPLSGEDDDESLQVQTTKTQDNSTIPGIEAFKQPTGELQALCSTIYFATNSYSINKDYEIKSLKKLADYIKRHPNLYLYIEGHTDPRGSQAFNYALGSRRANAVRSMLIQLGASGQHILTTSYGKERLVAKGNDESAWKLNRRAVFKTYVK